MLVIQQTEGEAMTRLADRVIFWVCLLIAVGLLVQAVHEHGYKQGAASCQPFAGAKLSLDRIGMRAEARWISYWKSK